MIDVMTIQLLGTLGKRVKVLRNERGVTAVEFTRALRRHGVDITPSHMSRIENGLAQPSIEVLRAIGDELDVSLDYLTMRTDVPNAPSSSETELATIYFSPEADEIARAVDAMAPYERQLALEHVRMQQRMAAERATEIQPAVDTLLMQSMCWPARICRNWPMAPTRWKS